MPNPYLAAIRSAKGRSTGPAHTLSTALDNAVTATEAGAWSGGKAGTFAGSLSGWRSTARRAATTSLDEFDDAIAQQPEMVEASSWQVHWHNLGPS
ncbi:MAG: hypothetical protein JWR85_3263 [Marmoricola sp.]|nr:hypothetical protein [Marmoricola sp.]